FALADVPVLVGAGLVVPFVLQTRVEHDAVLRGAAGAVVGLAGAPVGVAGDFAGDPVELALDRPIVIADPGQGLAVQCLRDQVLVSCAEGGEVPVGADTRGGGDGVAPALGAGKKQKPAPTGGVGRVGAPPATEGQGVRSLGVRHGTWGRIDARAATAAGAA